MKKSIHIGGLFGVGFDMDEKYLLTVSHSGLGIYETNTFSLISRDQDVKYPENEMVLGFGPLNGISIKIIEKDYDKDRLCGFSPSNKYTFNYDDGMLIIESSDQ